MIGDHAVVLLGHGPVTAPQAGLEVSEREAGLDRRHRGGHRRVHVPRNEHEIGLLALEHRLQRGHHAGRLLGVRARANAKEVVGSRHLEVLEEGVGEAAVIVLARMDKALIDSARPQRLHDRRHLHEVRSRPDHVEKLHP